MQAVPWFDIAVTALLIALFWAVQIGITVAVAFVIGGIVRAIEQTVRRKKVKLLPRVLVILVLICSILIALTLNPPVVCAERCEKQFTEEMREPVQSVSRGLYSANIPLVPAWVKVTEASRHSIDGREEYSLNFTIHYLWFGTVELEYDSPDGYNITRSLFGQ